MDLFYWWLELGLHWMMDWALQGVLPSGLEKVLKLLKRIPLFQFDFHSGLKIFGYVFPRAACLDMNFGPLSCQHTTGMPRFSLPVSAWGWPIAASRQSLKLSLSFCIPRVWISTSVLVRSAQNQLEFFPHPWLRQLTAVFKNVFLEALVLSFIKVLFKHPFHHKVSDAPVPS